VANLLERLGVEFPVVQAGMGGGLSGADLAAAVSEAGGLGTIGMLGPRPLDAEIAAARRVTAKPVAVNLLLPFARAADWEGARAADVVVTFWGTPRRRVPGTWIHQCGSVDEALASRAAGADAVIARAGRLAATFAGPTAPSSSSSDSAPIWATFRSCRPGASPAPRTCGPGSAPALTPWSPGRAF
jgi:hypothetical protein